MKNGKYGHKARKFNPKFTVVLVSVILVCATAVGVTLAYLTTDTAPVANTFQPSQVTSVVDETFDGQTKSHVKIQNTGDVSAFIRADIVVTWQCVDNQGNKLVLPEKPVLGTDYTMLLNASVTYDVNKWFKKGDFYYWPKEVAANEKTDDLIIEAVVDTISPKKDSDGNKYYVCIEVLCSAIQSEGVSGTTHPVEEAWGVTYHAGNPATIS